MPRKTSEIKRGHIWLPRINKTYWEITINGENVRTKIKLAEFMKILPPDFGTFSIELINFNKEYSNRYSKGQTVILYLDEVNGTTKKFEGIIEKIEDSRYGSDVNFVNIEGIQLSGIFRKVLVTRSYDGTSSFTQILDDLNSTFLASYGYTVNCTATSTLQPTINWNEKPLIECLDELAKIAVADCVIKDDKTIYFFDELSVSNDIEAIVKGITLRSLPGIGTQQATQKSKIRIYGEDGDGHPIIYTAGTGLSEEAIFDSKIITETQAKEAGDAELAKKDLPDALEGETVCRLLPSIDIGEKVWVSYPKIVNGQYKVYSFTHKFPKKQTTVILGNGRGIMQFYRKRIQKELALSTITNQYLMTGSFNWPFNDSSGISTKDSNVEIAEGKVYLSSGADGRFTTVTKTASSNITEVELRIIGSKLIGTKYEISTDGGASYQVITEGKNVLDNPNLNIILRVTLNSADTEIDSIALLYK
jgi:hypothetical protein